MKKLLSIILVLCLLCTVTITAFAEGESNPTEEPIPEFTPIFEPSTINPADCIMVSNPDIADPEVTQGTYVGSETLQAAVDNAVDPVEAPAEPDETPAEPVETQLPAGGGIIDVSEDNELGGVVIDESVNINLNGKDVVISENPVGSAGTETLGMQILNTAENVNIVGGGTLTIEDTAKDDEYFYMGIQNYSNLVLNNVTIDGQGLLDGSYVVSNNSGSLIVTEGASIIAGEGDVAFDVYTYAPYYPDAPDVLITETAGTIDGIIEFDGTPEAAKMIANTPGASEPSLTIQGGTFKNFLLKIGAAVEQFMDNIKISGGNFDSNEVYVETYVVEDGQTVTAQKLKEDGSGYVIDDFLKDDTYVVVTKDDGTYQVMTKAEADALKKPIVAVIPDPEPVYVPAPQPAAPAPVVVAPTAPVAVEVNGATVELAIVAEDIKAEAVAPVAEGKAAELKVKVAPAALAAEGAEAEEVVEALVATATVSVKDGDTLAAKDYQISMNAKGELKVELSAEYLKTLGVGEHVIVLNIGGIEIEFTIIIK